MERKPKLETFKRFEICIDHELDLIDLLAIEIECLKYDMEVAVASSKRLMIIQANNLGDIIGLLEYLELWDCILNVREITDYTPSWKLNLPIVEFRDDI